MSRAFFDRLAGPPRHVPLGVRLYALFGATVMSQVAWGLLALVSVIAWSFAGNADPWSPLAFRMAATSQAEGVVTSVVETVSSEGRTRIREVSYRFTVEDGQERSGRSYVTGSAPGVGEQVIVESLDALPSISRIQGMRRARFGLGALAALIFVPIPLGMVLFTLGLGLSLNRALAHGRAVTAQLQSLTQDSKRARGQPTMKLTFGLIASDGVFYTASRITTGSNAPEAPSALLLYVPAEPKSGMLAEALPKAIHADEQGNLHLKGAGSLAVFMLPLLAVFTNAFAAHLMLFR